MEGTDGMRNFCIDVLFFLGKDTLSTKLTKNFANFANFANGWCESVRFLR